MEKTFIAVVKEECAVGNSLEEAFLKLSEISTYELSFGDVQFYEGKLLKAKQVIVIENEEKKNSD